MTGFDARVEWDRSFRLTTGAAAYFAQAAQNRGVKPAKLVRLVLDHIARDDLVAAVMDDGPAAGAAGTDQPLVEDRRHLAPLSAERAGQAARRLVVRAGGRSLRGFDPKERRSMAEKLVWLHADAPQAPSTADTLARWMMRWGAELPPEECGPSAAPHADGF